MVGTMKHPGRMDGESWTWTDGRDLMVCYVLRAPTIMEVPVGIWCGWTPARNLVGVYLSAYLDCEEDSDVQMFGEIDLYQDMITAACY